MSETLTQCDSMPILPPPTPSRKPRVRVREVSSRFMSPITPSPSSGEILHPATVKSKSSAVLSTPARQLSPRFNSSVSSTDEYKSEISQGFDRATPMRSGLVQSKAKPWLHRRSKSSDSGKMASSSFRPDTPMAVTSDDSLVSGRLRNGTLNSHRSLAASLLPSSGVSTSDSGSSLIGSPIQKSKTRPLADLRSSMPEADMLPNRLLTEKNCNSDTSSFSESPCSRSLNFPLSSNCENSLYSSVTSEKLANFVKTGGRIILPPRPPCAKPDLDSRKGRKGSSHQEDVHSLRMLHTHYLQWRFVNAKSEVSMHAQKREAEKTLYSLGVKISELYDVVERKRVAVELLRRLKNVSTIVEAQMPDLDEWSAIEEEYTTSLSETIQALVNASLQLPISGNVRTDKRDIGEALNSATKVMETIASHLKNFMPKVEEIENLTSQLAKVSGAERTLVEDCGELLSTTHSSQVEECSLRSQLIQLQSTNNQSQTTE